MRYVLFGILATFIFSSTGLLAQEIQVAGTPLFLDYEATGLRASERDARILVDEERQAFLFVEVRDMTPGEYQLAEPEFFKIREVLHEEKLERGAASGYIKKSLISTQGPERVLWLAWLPVGDRVVDIKGGYTRDLDSLLAPAYLDALRTMRVDPATTGQQSAGLPVRIDAAERGYSPEPSYMPNTMLWKKQSTDTRLLSIHWFARDKTEQPDLTLYADEAHQEIHPMDDRIIAWTWRTASSPESQDEPVFEATIFFPEWKVLLLAYGEYSAAMLEELREITHNITMQ